MSEAGTKRLVIRDVALSHATAQAYDARADHSAALRTLVISSPIAAAWGP